MVSAVNLFVILIVSVFVIILLWMAFRVGVKSGRSEREIEWQSNLVRLRGDIANRQRVGIKGRIAETFAPFLQGFPFKASECKFIGDPIDYVVFEGLDERDIKGVHFVEVKSDKSKMSKHQKQIKDLIDSIGDEKISFHTFGFRSGNE